MYTSSRHHVAPASRAVLGRGDGAFAPVGCFYFNSAPLPVLPTRRFGRPFIILREQEKKSRLKGLEAQKANITAARLVSGLVRTSLGPKGERRICWLLCGRRPVRAAAALPLFPSRRRTEFCGAAANTAVVAVCSSVVVGSGVAVVCWRGVGVRREANLGMAGAAASRVLGDRPPVLGASLLVVRRCLPRPCPSRVYCSFLRR